MSFSFDNLKIREKFVVFDLCFILTTIAPKNIKVFMFHINRKGI